MAAHAASVAFFVRDPVSRFRSGFDDRRRKGQPRYFYEWTRAEAEAFAVFDTAEELGAALGARGSRLRDRATLAMTSIDHVRHTYVRTFGDLPQLRSLIHKVAFVGFQEELAESFAAFKRFAGLPESLPLPADDLNAHRSSGSRPPLSDDAARNLRRWYEDDYRIYDFLRDRFSRA